MSSTFEAPGDLLVAEPAVPSGILIGYGHVSTRQQNLSAQTDAFKAAGCRHVFIDTLSEKNTERPWLLTCVACEPRACPVRCGSHRAAQRGNLHCGAAGGERHGFVDRAAANGSRRDGRWSGSGARCTCGAKTAAATEGFSGADIAHVAKAALQQALSASMEAGAVTPSTASWFDQVAPVRSTTPTTAPSSSCGPTG
ncbi:hypothetical protein [Phytomonospora endophytica]|uniref:Resolvase/invertase-type recombinase catalytic domain-containing protein n=1 Tax=Phytomonospora endophytica TaxID=714109 RepID=A0A841FU82_9ACTN|nr:hypothetical protein [Phytomonospora endophytica]MBB6039566.1 hypothetical protein [Phytomonospora endophytica]GIG70532.1 hypothetical protein Pen01_68270 [Phytomonospora endophytica]